ncbi:MAG: carboxypeptidase M32 [Flavobacteriales bacterium]|nr:carboxypeptidase M32 [Flavobacteriales bacterium]
MTDYERYKELSKKIADIYHASALLQWDQETYMPPKSAPTRAQQLSTLAGIGHELSVDESFGELISNLVSDDSLSEIEKRNIVQSKKDYDKSLKYTTEFVKEMSETVSAAFQAWQKAKAENNFSLFAPKLEKLVALKRKECELIGYDEHPYDALLDEFEPGAKTSTIETVFENIKPKLISLLDKISGANQNNDSFMFKHYPKDKQWDFGIDLLKQMNYDFDAGRQDISTHPFTTSFSSNDVRVTTRINENDVSEMIWSCIHEGGHGLYEQGLKSSEYGLPSGSYLSLSIHESQSRLWENNVGRSLPYWKKNYPLAQEYFSEQLVGVSAKDFYKGMNVVKSSLIRTSADELTYHFHVMIRFEIEKSLIEGSIEVRDLPTVWNAKYKEYMGITVPNDEQGVLQDIHWSHGSFGYFPTYSLGSFYAAQFFAQAKKEIPELNTKIENGELLPLLNWLRDKIHQHGKTYTSDELCTMVTGETLNSDYFLKYAEEKYGNLYGIK